MKEKKKWYKRWWIWLIIVIVALIVISGLGNMSSDDTKSNSSSTEKTENTIKRSGDFSFDSKKDVYKTDKATLKITKAKVMPSADNKEVIVLECDITNNSKKEFDLVNGFNPYEFIHAYQKTDTSNKSLDPGVIGLDANANSLEKVREDVMTNDSVLPGKTVQGVISFALVNKNNVQVKFSDSSYSTIATKTFKYTPQVTE